MEPSAVNTEPSAVNMSPPQQILHVVAELDGYGLTRQLELLVDQQLANGQRVRVVSLAAALEADASLERMGVDCRVLDRRWHRDPFAAIRLARELRRNAFDLLHLWGQPAVDYFSAVRRWVPATPTITSLSEDAPSVAPSEATTLSRQQFLADQLLPDDAILIAVAGPLCRTQRVDEAIWNFELVRTLESRARLLIFGDGPDRPRCERFSRLASEPCAIRFLGYRPDFRALLPHADLFWHTAAPSENFPQTILEAMAARVPVVATDGPACSEILRDTHTGYLIPNGDRAIFARHSLRLLGDSQLASRLTANAADTIAQRFSIEAMTERYALKKK